MATGSSWSSSTSPMRSFMSAGPSISTCAGRSARMVSRTTRAHAGLWWRAPVNVAGVGSAGGGARGVVDPLPVTALLPGARLLEGGAQAVEILGVVLGGRAAQALDDVGLVPRLAPQEPPPQADGVGDRHRL